MKKIKTILFIVIYFTIFSVNAQEKNNEKAIGLTKKFNEKLGNNALTIEQENQVTAIYTEKLKEMNDLKKEDISDENRVFKIKELHKEFSKKIQKILTKDQKIALKEFKNNN